jgi:hypothetical protein
MLPDTDDAQRLRLLLTDALHAARPNSLQCRECSALAGRPCHNKGGRRRFAPHAIRTKDAEVESITHALLAVARNSGASASPTGVNTPWFSTPEPDPRYTPAAPSRPRCTDVIEYEHEPSLSARCHLPPYPKHLHEFGHASITHDGAYRVTWNSPPPPPKPRPRGVFGAASPGVASSIPMGATMRGGISVEFETEEIWPRTISSAEPISVSFDFQPLSPEATRALFGVDLTTKETTNGDQQ